MFGFARKSVEMVSTQDALPGRAAAIATAQTHFVNGNPLSLEVPDGMEEAMFGMGCFWGVERMFWSIPGVYATMVGYAGGYTPNATYEEVCTGKTGHNEVVRVVYDPSVVSFEALLEGRSFGVQGSICAATVQRGVRRHHDGDFGCAGILLCRRVSPTISCQEPVRLLRDWRNRCDLPDRC